MSLYRTYNNKVMEAIRMLTTEEMMCVLHDVALALHKDRLRDLGESQAVKIVGGIRPGWASLGALEHAMLTANFKMPGVQTKKDLEAIFGPEEADRLEKLQEELLAYMNSLGDLMEDTNCDMNTASIMQAMKDHPSTQEVQEAPDDLEGFGWA